MEDKRQATAAAGLGGGSTPSRAGTGNHAPSEERNHGGSANNNGLDLLFGPRDSGSGSGRFEWIFPPPSARLVMAFAIDRAVETPFPHPDMSSPSSNLANLSFIAPTSAPSAFESFSFFEIKFSSEFPCLGFSWRLGLDFLKGQPRAGLRERCLRSLSSVDLSTTLDASCPIGPSSF